MIVEVFFRGTNFEKLFDTLWTVKKVERSGSYYVVSFEDCSVENACLDVHTYELRVS